MRKRITAALVLAAALVAGGKPPLYADSCKNHSVKDCPDSIINSSDKKNGDGTCTSISTTHHCSVISGRCVEVSSSSSHESEPCPAPAEGPSAPSHANSRKP